jgi:branched-chain amino acid aminotransferase
MRCPQSRTQSVLRPRCPSELSGVAPITASLAWLDGKFVAWDDARVHVHTQCVLRGANVFEGIRAYWNSDEGELYVFKMPEHMARLAQSMKLLRIALPYPLEVVAEASIELLRRCAYREDVHFRPVVYIGESEDNFGLDPRGTTIGAFIFALPRPQRPVLDSGLHVSVSSWQRITDASLPPRIKAGANYLNSRLAASQARIDGYDSTIILNERSKVSELPGSCMMMVRHNRLVTPPLTDNILESITRDTIIQFARDDLGMTVEERTVDRTELYVADELFECGSGEEITPIVSVDRQPVGDGMRGKLTRDIQDFYFAMVRGQNPKYRHHLVATYGTTATAELPASAHS